jgi:hypothetical protein
MGESRNEDDTLLTWSPMCFGSRECQSSSEPCPNDRYDAVLLEGGGHKVSVEGVRGDKDLGH